MTFCRKPIEVEAVQFTGSNAFAIWSFLGRQDLVDNPEMHNTDAPFLATYTGGRRHMRPGDWVVKQGCTFACWGQDAFAETFSRKPEPEVRGWIPKHNQNHVGTEFQIPVLPPSLLPDALDATKIWDTYVWSRQICRWFDSNEWDKHHMCRFSFGVYQIHQAIDWAGTNAGAESVGASVIHFLGALGMVYDAPPLLEGLDSDRPVRHWHEVGEAEARTPERILKLISKAQQQHMYIRHHRISTTRSRRINLPQLARDTFELCNQVMRLCPAKFRKVGVETAMQTLINLEFTR